MPNAPADPLTILIVEDEILIRSFLVDALEDIGFKVLQAGSAAEALEQFGALAGRIVAIILDVGLPDRRGDDLVAEFRVLQADVPIMLMTGHEEGPLHERFKDDHRLVLCLKPFGCNDVASIFRTLSVPIPMPWIALERPSNALVARSSC